MDFYFLFCSPQGTINRDEVIKNSNFVLCFCTPCGLDGSRLGWGKVLLRLGTLGKQLVVFVGQVAHVCYHGGISPLVQFVDEVHRSLGFGDLWHPRSSACQNLGLRSDHKVGQMLSLVLSEVLVSTLLLVC